MECIYDLNGSAIYDVSGEYVIKYVKSPDNDEVRVVQRVRDMKPRSCVLFREDKGGLDWYAMQRYDGHVIADLFCRTHWRTLIKQVLEFLEDLHHLVGIAHMDIKKGNILVDRVNCLFHVCDFGNTEPPKKGRRPLRTYEASTKWYYVAMGADLDQPLVSWRADLVALGYAVSGLLPSGPYLHEWQFECECWLKREGRGLLREETLLGLRQAEISQCTELTAYFAHVETLAWDALEPPPRSFYQELAELF